MSCGPDRFFATDRSPVHAADCITGGMVYDRLTLGRQRARDRRGEERKEEAHLVNPLQSHLSSSSISFVFLVDWGFCGFAISIVFNVYYGRS
jgi:hypothetical protein